MACMIIFVFIFCISSTYCVIQPNVNQESKGLPEDVVDGTKQIDSSKQKENANQVPEVNIVEEAKRPKENDKSKEVSKVVVTTSKTPIVSNIKNNNTDADIEGGAVLRGVFVFVGITLLLIMYLTCKTYRKRNKKNVLIKKYGVKARRTDVEMEPLPLDDDEEDETVFDLGNVNNR